MSAGRRHRPGPRLVQGIAALTALALLLPFVPVLRWPLLLLLGALAGAALAEARVLARAGLVVRRQPAFALSVGEPERVAFEIATSARRPLAATVRQRWPSLLDERSTTASGRASASSPLRLDLPVRGVARGTAALEPPTVALTAWGFVERVAAAGEAATLAVLPNVRAVSRLAKKLDRLALRGLGSRFSPQAGRGREFERLRDYVKGDDLRDMAWKASARHGRLIVREHRIDRTQDVVVALDRSHRMAARVGDLTRLDHAVNAALQLAWLSGRVEDRIALATFAAEASMILRPGRGVAHQRRIVRALTELSAEHAHADHRALAVALRHGLEHRSLVVIVTDVPEAEDEVRGLVEGVRLLMPQHLPFVALMSDPDLDAAASLVPASHEELCRTLVARDLTFRRKQVVLELRRLGALVVTPRPGDAGTEAINGYLEVKRRQLL